MESKPSMAGCVATFSFFLSFFFFYTSLVLHSFFLQAFFPESFFFPFFVLFFSHVVPLPYS